MGPTKHAAATTSQDRLLGTGLVLAALATAIGAYWLVGGVAAPGHGEHARNAVTSTR